MVRGTLHRDITPEEVSGALTANEFSSAPGGLLGVTPVTSYSENIGMTGVVNRTVAWIMILYGLCPPSGTLSGRSLLPSSAGAC